MQPKRLKVLLIGLVVDGTDVGEALVAHKWAEAISRHADTTLLCLQPPNRKPVQEQLPDCRVVTWSEPSILVRQERIRALLKPAWPLFCLHVHRWIANAHKQGEHFDIAHQLVPQAMRNATPLRGHGIPYVMGPMGGSLNTPAAFEHEIEPQAWYLKLRHLDSLRLRLDPRLRRTFSDASLVLGVAPYVGEYLSQFVTLKRFEAIYQFAAEPLQFKERRARNSGELKLLHVGRAVRTKGLRDVIRALAHLRDRPGITLTSAGSGADLDACIAEAKKLGVTDRVTFLGQVPRAEVEKLYAAHDVFCFPSFREPMAGVFFEAMRWGLPIIGADRGGAQALLDESFAIKVPVETPAQFAQDLAHAVRRLCDSPELTERLGHGAQTRLSSLGSWDGIGDRMVGLYREVL